MEILALVVMAVLFVVIGAILSFGGPKGPSLDQVAHLIEPSILEMEAQKVLLVKAKGDPSKVAKLAFGLLMKTYFQLKGVPRSGPAFKPPRGRWPVDSGKDPEEWEGLYAMPVPDRIEKLPEVKEVGGLAPELATWEYGTVAQILHVGAYDKEAPTVEMLKEFVQSEGYRISGMHEEEYLRGPGFLLAGNPDTYLTLIRYPVERVAQADS